MSEKLCTLRTKGGGGGVPQTETVLWTNPTPAANFNAQTVTLSDSISNYDYIGIVYVFNKSNTGISSRAIYSVSDFKNSLQPGAFKDVVTLSIVDTTYIYTRQAYYITDTSIGFTACYRVNNAYNTADGSIPTAIIGIKNMGGIRTNEKYDYVPFTDFPGGQTLTWNTKGRAKAVWIIMGVKNDVDYIRTNVNPSTGELDDTNVYYYNDNASGASPTIQSGVSITITDNTVSTNAFSGSTRRFALIYTY